MRSDHARWNTLVYRLILLMLVAAMLVGCAVPEKTAGSTGVVSAAAVVPTVEIPQQAQLQSARGTVEVQTGADWAPLPVSGELPSLGIGQHVRTGDLSSVQVSFADGSLVTLEANSELSVDELDVRPGAGPRIISMTQTAGESQHSVAPSADTGSLYEVHTPNGTASAKGTQFFVWVLPDQSSYLHVVEGSVVVIAAQVTVTVNAGQMTFFLLNGPPALPVAYLSGEGPVTQIGETWTIAGLTFKARTDTFLIGAIHLGDVVHFEGHLLADGSRALDLVTLLQPSPANTFRLQGAVQKIDAAGWTVNGTAISLTPQTQIENGIVVGDPVVVEGLILPSGVFQAVRIFKDSEESGLPFEFTGPVQEIGPEHWTIAGVNVSVNPQTVIGDEIAAGKLVRVSGRIQSDGTWLAKEITLAGEHERQFEFTGEIESVTPWRVAGVSFETRSWTRIEPGLKVGDRVRVSGTVQVDGVWVAAEIQLLSRPDTRLILVGPVLSINPWVVSGLPLKITPQTIILGSLKIGMLVRVEARLLSDGTWEAIRIEPLMLFVWIPTCLDIKVVFVSLNGSLIQFQGWPQMTLPAGTKLNGVLVPNGSVLVRMCFSASFVLQIVMITVITITPPAATVEPVTDKVLICHKPDKKKGGSTMLLPRSALGGHLGHGDYLGACQ